MAAGARRRTGPRRHPLRRPRPDGRAPAAARRGAGVAAAPGGTGHRRGRRPRQRPADAGPHRLGGRRPRLPRRRRPRRPLRRRRCPAPLVGVDGAVRAAGRGRGRRDGRVDRVRTAQRTAGAGAGRGAAPERAAPGAGPRRPSRSRGARGGGRDDGAGRRRCGAADGVAGPSPRRDPPHVRTADRGLVGVAGGAAALRHAAAERGGVGGGLRPRPRLPARHGRRGDTARCAGGAAVAAVPAAGGGAGPRSGHGAARDGRGAAADGGSRGGVVRRAGIRDGRRTLRHPDARADRRCGGVRGGARAGC
ncbi:hypothetical protein GA0115245_106012 [Streptomyces sp. di188]|nr:hypothetical protein GA0115245_106012 [Streptomyces sp. di188]